MIIHVWHNEYNDTYWIEDNKDNVLEDEFDSAEEAYEYACEHYPEATDIYRY